MYATSLIVMFITIFSSSNFIVNLATGITRYMEGWYAIVHTIVVVVGCPRLYILGWTLPCKVTDDENEYAAEDEEDE